MAGHARIRGQNAGSGLLHRARTRMPRRAGTARSAQEGIVLARNKRLEEIEQSLNALGEQLEAKANTVGGQVLLNPYSSPHAIANIESITGDLNAFANTLQLRHIHLQVEGGPTWIQAAGKAVDDTGKAC